jgi:acyl-CoA thioesterase-2
MMGTVEELLNTLTLERTQADLFRGVSQQNERQHLFGGQLAAQALMAAYGTIDGQICHSLHSYFLRAGNAGQPIDYRVERTRESRSFAARRVIAMQGDTPIFHLDCSFQTPELSAEHQAPLPDTMRPDAIPEPPPGSGFLGHSSPIEMRSLTRFGASSVDKSPSEHIWFRARGHVGEDIALNQAILTFALDLFLLPTSMRPHGGFNGNMQIASLDHLVWFHRPTDCARWHLSNQTSPSLTNARGFTRSEIFREDGVLVASAVQEGLVRQRPNGVPG